MKRTIFITICLFSIISNLLYAQETNATYQKPIPAHENQISSGFYFVQLQTENRTAVKKLVVE